MSKNKASQRRLEALERQLDECRGELEVARRSQAKNGVYGLLNRIVVWGALVWMVDILADAAKEFAGKITLTDITNIQEFSVNEWLAMFLLFSLGFNFWQRKHTKDTVQHLEGAKRLRELALDPDRSTSELTVRGETAPEDRT